MTGKSGGAELGKEEGRMREGWLKKWGELRIYIVTGIWGLGNYTYIGKLSKLGKKALLTFNDKMTQNIHMIFH